jgi:hypothetical protein
MQNSRSRITIVTGLWAGQLRSYHSNPDRRVREFFFLDQLCGPPSFLFSGHQWSCPGKKWKGVEVGQSLPSCAEVQNVQSYTSTSLYAFVVYTRITLPSCYGLLLSAIAFPFVLSYCITSYSSTVSLPVCLYCC